MERYNPFAAESAGTTPTGPDSDPDPFASNPIRRQLSASNSSAKTRRGGAAADGGQRQASLASRYSTSFPDPFGDELAAVAAPAAASPVELSSLNSPTSRASSVGRPRATGGATVATPGNRSNSVTFLHRVDDDDRDQQEENENENENDEPLSRSGRTAGLSSTAGASRHATGQRMQSGLGSFLSRATSVTSSSVSERVTGAVGSVRSAVDSLSSQIQSAAAASNLSSPSSQQAQQSLASPTTTTTTTSGSSDCQKQQQQQQSAASYLASKFSSATNQLVGGASNQAGPMPVISRQRVVLILDNLAGSDWAAQFLHYKRLISGLNPTTSGPSSAFTSFLASQFSSPASSSAASQEAGADLIEQVDFGDASVLANQANSTVTVYVGGPSALLLNNGALMGGATIGSSGSLTAAATKVVRPEFVVVRQRGRERLEHLRNIVKALHYCSVPLFEPFEVWNTFQDRQLIFARLLRVQKQLGKEHFPLIPQLYCQTHQDLFNYIQNGTVALPCLVRTGPLGKGRITIESLQVLRDFASIMATSQQGCTIEQFLEVKCDLVVQRLGTSLKLFRNSRASPGAVPAASRGHHQPFFGQQQQQVCDSDAPNQRQALSLQQSQEQVSPGPAPPLPLSFGARQSASRQTSLGSGVLSSLLSSTSSGFQQVVSSSVGASAARRTSNPAPAPCAFEKLSEVNARYRNWVEAIKREFGHQIDAFSLKIVVASNDREYIVGLRNCSTDFLGNQENQEEDRRSFVELVISKMNTVLPKHQPTRGDELSSSLAGAQATAGAPQQQQQQQQQQLALRRTSSDEQRQNGFSLAGRKSSATFMSQTDVKSARPSPAAGQLSSRCRSASMNQGDSVGAPARLANTAAGGGGGGGQSFANRSQQSFGARRSSERSDSQPTGAEDELPGGLGSPGAGSKGRQPSLGQSIFEQTSTAFGSLQKQSMSFLKRLDSRAGPESLSGTSTPPMSAKSDSGFERNFTNPEGEIQSPVAGDQAHQRNAINGSGSRAGIKSQSIDAASSSSLDGRAGFRPSRSTPPKPPPPPPFQASMNRQSSLANYSSSQARAKGANYETGGAPATPSQTPRQNSAASGSMESAASSSPIRQQRVLRQNSALSAFEPFDPDLKLELMAGNRAAAESSPGGATETRANTQDGQQHQQRGSIESTGSTKKRPGGAYDTASVASGNSNGTDETTTAEDTMNNLKKTFASIFGDKCE